MESEGGGVNYNGRQVVSWCALNGIWQPPKRPLLSLRKDPGKAPPTNDERAELIERLRQHLAEENRGYFEALGQLKRLRLAHQRQLVARAKYDFEQSRKVIKR